MMMKKNLVRMMLGLVFLLFGSTVWAQNSAQSGIEKGNTQLHITPGGVQATVSPTPHSATRQGTLTIWVSGFSADPQDVQKVEVFYGFNGIYDEAGMQLIGIKGNTKEVFAQRIQALNQHPLIDSFNLDEMGEVLNITVKGLTVANLLTLITQTTTD